MYHSSLVRTAETRANQLVTSRLYSWKTAVMSSKLSEGSDARQIETELSPLLHNGWQVDREKMGVEKTFFFKNYSKCMDFSTIIAAKAKAANHHPTITLVRKAITLPHLALTHQLTFSSVHIHWTTHKPRGLSEKDTKMATLTDAEANAIGQVEQQDAKSCE